MISNTGRTPGYASAKSSTASASATSIDAMVFSNEHGECKPRTSIFDALRDQLGVDYDEMMFVGDNLYVDVHGAQRCGMRRRPLRSARTRGDAVAPPSNTA